MASLGYARVSTNLQDLSTQKKRLITEGVKDSSDFLFTDKASGKNDERTGLKLMLTKAREGDVIIVTKLDRLGRNTVDMISIIDDLHSRNIAVKFLDDGISTEGTMGKMVVTILAAVAQAERERILERTNEGRRSAIAKGVKMGRKRSIDNSVHQKVIELVKAGEAKTKIASDLNISRQSVYLILNNQSTII
ncbi:MAG: recombinase family protein [Colwellia sp.]|nr:recombinase family protein [Colwellia sp.]